ncbi:MAG: hypothetical protein H6807_00740 [Planctomycetes bacterium]|nr:hypothetical protein [Planctomycetota bacterium]
MALLCATMSCRAEFTDYDIEDLHLNANSDVEISVRHVERKEGGVVSIEYDLVNRGVDTLTLSTMVGASRGFDSRPWRRRPSRRPLLNTSLLLPSESGRLAAFYCRWVSPPHDSGVILIAPGGKARMVVEARRGDTDEGRWSALVGRPGARLFFCQHRMRTDAQGQSYSESLRLLSGEFEIK